MGVGTISKFSHKRVEEELFLKYSIVRRDVINSIIYLQDKISGQEFVMKELTTNDQRSQFRLQELVRQKASQKELFTLKLQDFLYEDAQEYCSYRFKAYLIFEHPCKDLKLDILERRMKGHKYQEQQLLYIVVSIIKGLKFLRQIDHPHEAVCSRNVYLFSNKTVKLSDPWLKTSNLSQLPSYHIYPSPQKLQAETFLQSVYDWYLSDLFSLGMLGLEAYYLEFMHDLYINKTLNQQLLDHKIDSLKYVKFRKLIKGLLGPHRLRYQVVADFCSEFTSKIQVSPSPPRSNNISPSSPHKASPKVIHRSRSPPFKGNIITKPNFITPNQTSFKKIGPKIGLPHSKTHNIISMNMQIQQSLPNNLKDIQFPSIRFPKQNNLNYELNPQSVSNNIKEPHLHLLSKNQVKYKSASLGPKLMKLVEMTNDPPYQGYEIKNSQVKYGQQHLTLRKGVGTQLQSDNFQISSIAPTDPWKTISKDQYITKQTQIKQSNFIPFSQTNKNKSRGSLNNHKHKYHQNKNTSLTNIRNQTKTIPEVTQNSTLSLDQELDQQFEALKLYSERQIASQTSNHIKYINGSYYIGSILNNKRQGNGRLFSPDDKVIYDGEWKDDQYHGFGRLISTSSEMFPIFPPRFLNDMQRRWISYEGEFYFGRKNGFGKLILANGDVFEGVFENDRIHGAGIYISQNGSLIRGHWNKGSYVLQ